MCIEYAIGKCFYNAPWYEITDGCSQANIKRVIYLYALVKSQRIPLYTRIRTLHVRKVLGGKSS